MKTFTKKDVIDDFDLYYFRERERHNVYQMIISYFADKHASEGLTQADLAKKLKKEPSQISRWLSGPANMTLDTISDLLLAMDAEVEFRAVPILKDGFGQD